MMPPSMWPDCAVCGTPVAVMERWQDQMTNETVFVARCHGATEVTRLPMIMFVGDDRVSAGVAFAPKPPPAIKDISGKLIRSGIVLLMLTMALTA